MTRLTELHNSPKIAQISSAITALTAERVQELQQQAQQLRDQRLQQAEAHLTYNMEQLYKERFEDLQVSLAEERVRSLQQLRQALFATRESYAENAFAAAEAEIKSFVASQAYPPFLELLCEMFCRRYSCEEGEVRLRVDDMALVDNLVPLFPKSCRLVASPEIRLGGLMMWLPQQRLLVDERLERRLAYQRQWFYEHSGLVLS
ncbi:MAG: V-type ATP synthase subunit E family protein [Symbiobacteriaceae bacterium]|nr:V-type ATP synthase subunit E family protein [Symbiobacteriaceae bacterium]